MSTMTKSDCIARGAGGAIHTVTPTIRTILLAKQASKKTFMITVLEEGLVMLLGRWITLKKFIGAT